MPSLSEMFPPIGKPDRALLFDESARAVEVEPAPALDLEDHHPRLTFGEGMQVFLFTHVPYIVMIEALHLRLEPLSMIFMVYVTGRFAVGDNEHFARRALLAGLLSAGFCAWLQFLLQPRHP